MEERVKAAMSHGGLLQAELDGLKACHDKALNEAHSHISQLQEQIGEQQQQLEESGKELSRCQQALDRCVWCGQHDADYAVATLLALLCCITLASNLHLVWCLLSFAAPGRAAAPIPRRAAVYCCAEQLFVAGLNCFSLVALPLKWLYSLFPLACT